MNDAGWIASACGGRLVAGDAADAGARRAVVDSRAATSGDLFVGLVGERVDGGEFARAALDAGAWGVLVAEPHASRLADSQRPVIAVPDPLAALAELARAWRRELGAKVVGITGSTGKTSTKDIVAGILRPHMTVHATHENFNTEIGLPLTILESARGTECLVLEMAMRGPGQIAELTRIAEPDVGVIVNVGPVHLELLGTIERVASAKAELIAGLRPGAVSVVPFGDRLIARHIRGDLRTLTFGPGGNVQLVSFKDGIAQIDAEGKAIRLSLPFSEPHNLRNTLAAVAVAAALGVEPSGPLDVRFSSLRGAIVELEAGITVVNDCYNANPMSMRAALESLAETPAGRRVAILGHMAELGPDAERFHREVGEQAGRLGIDVLITVGEQAFAIAEGFGSEWHAVASPEEARDVLDEIAQRGDRVLIKASRSAGLERILEPVGGAA